MRSISPVILTIRSITVLAWMTVIYDALPFWPYLPEATGRLAAIAAVCGTFKYISCRLSKPAYEVYEAGRAMGRKQLLLEQANAEQVFHLADRRRLRQAQPGERRVVPEGSFS